MNRSAFYRRTAIISLLLVLNGVVWHEQSFGPSPALGHPRPSAALIAQVQALQDKNQHQEVLELVQAQPNLEIDP